MKGTETILQALVQRQAQLGEADGDFAARLGVTRQAWQQARTGVWLPGERMLKGASSAFPELTHAIMSLFLPEKAAAGRCRA